MISGRIEDEGQGDEMGPWRLPGEIQVKVRKGARILPGEKNEKVT